jgi:hypothetical protein
MGEIQNQIRMQGLTNELKAQEAKVNQQLEGQEKTRRDSMETEIAHPMAQGRGTQHQILSQNCHPKKALQ